ncbi:MAG: hypothetical protein V4580_02080 [Bacteroidota bacterium]
MFNLSIGICIIILLFLVPGALFRKAFNSVKLSDYHIRASSFSEIILTIALSLFIQFLGLVLLEGLDLLCPNMYQVDYHVVSSIISSKNENVFQPLEDHLILIVSYQIVLNIICILSARLLLGFIINNKLDQRFKFLRFDNEWHYILSGRHLNPNKEVVKYANVLVDMEEFYLIYTGFLADYSVDKEGNLKLIELERVKRKVISKDEKTDNTTKEYIFNVDSLFIPYDKILNFSITYFNIDEVSDPLALPEGSSSPKPNKLKRFLKEVFWSRTTIIIVLLIIIWFKSCK